MPSELSKQLGDFRTKHKVAPVVQKVSFLFDPTRAAGLDILSMALIARKSLLNLVTVEPSLEAFEDLFTGSDKSVEFMTQDEQGELKLRMKHLLALLSGHFKTLDAQQCLEYLIQKYHVHLYNGEELILLALPYHDTPLFGTLIKLLPFLKSVERANASETRWTFLRNVHKSGSPLSRLALVRMCRSSQPVMTAIIDHVIDSLKHGVFNQALLSFVNIVLLEVLSEFNSIRYDISILLFSLCRICFKVSQHCVSAYFVGLSVATHIICVADVRNDALALLLSRAITACPADKLYALLMALNVISGVRKELPESIAVELSKLAGFPTGVETCVTTFNSDLSQLMSAIADESVIATMKAAIEQASASIAMEDEEAQPGETMPEETAEESDDSSSSSDDEEDQKLNEARKILTALIAKGTKKDRTDAVAKYAAVEGATRHCIRLSALCDSVESLSLTMKHAKRDMGFVPTLISVLDQFKKSNPRMILQAVFADLTRIPPGSMAQVGQALGVADAASLMAISRNMESEFQLSSAVWKAMGALTAGSQVAKSSLISEWKNEYLPSGFLSVNSKDAIKTFAETFIEFANNAKIEAENDDQVETVLGQLVCAVTIPNSVTRQALTDLAKNSFGSLSDSERSAVVQKVVESGSLAIVKKLNQIEISSVDCGNETLVASLVTAIQDGGSAEVWALLSSLLKLGMPIKSELLLGAIGKAASGIVSASAWKCLSSSPEIVLESSETLTACMDLAKRSLLSSNEVSGILDALLAISLSEKTAELMDASSVGSIISQLVRFVVSGDHSISDTLIVTAQSASEALLNTAAGINFDSAWTSLLSSMTELVKAEPDRAMAYQIRCLILLAGLVGQDDMDSETVTSKQLGQVVLGLVELVNSSAVQQIDSWTGLSNSDVELSSVIEKITTQFLLQCTLKKLDKFYRRLIASDSEARLAMAFRIYASVCEEAGEGAVLALHPIAGDEIIKALKSGGAATKKRKRNMDVVVAALRAATASCIEQLPESSFGELMDAVAELPGHLDDNSVVAETCVGIVKVASSEQIKSFTKLLMQRSTDSSSPFTQECVVRTVLALWRSAGEVMVPAITEVTVFLNELFNSPEQEVADITRQLVQEIDRVTGEKIEEKLSGF